MQPFDPIVHLFIVCRELQHLYGVFDSQPERGQAIKDVQIVMVGARALDQERDQSNGKTGLVHGAGCLPRFAGYEFRVAPAVGFATVK